MAFETVCINNIYYEVFDFRYISGIFNGDNEFILLENVNFQIDKEKIKTGKIYIVIPSWVEMQDLYQCSSRKNPMTLQYEVCSEKMNENKIYKLCPKIIDENEKTLIMSKVVAENLYIDLIEFISEKIDEVIHRHYVGIGLSKEEQKILEYSCYKYYAACQKQVRGEYQVVLPLAPGAVVLLNICDIFNCTPDVARRISKKDIDMITIAKNQKDITKNPQMTGMDCSKFNPKKSKKRR